MEKYFCLIDGNALFCKSFYGFDKKEYVSPKGKAINGVYGFFSHLHKIIGNNKASHMIIAFDSCKNFRKEIFADYKGNRPPKPKELIEQLEMVKVFLNKVYNIKIVEKENYEADDLIGSLAKEIESKNTFEKIKIITTDKDLLQLLTSKTNVILSKKGLSEVLEYNTVKLKEDYSLTPNQFVEMKTLSGDSSDNIKGIKGIGEKTAIKYLTRFGSLKNMLRTEEEFKHKEMLKEKTEELKIFYKLVKIRTNLELKINFDKCSLSNIGERKKTIDYNLKKYNLALTF